MKGLSKTRFQQVFEQGVHSSGKYCKVYLLPGEGRQGYAATRSAGSRPIRNRIKRRFKESLRCLSIPEISSYDLVILGKKLSLERSLSELVNELEYHIRKLLKRWEQD